MAVRFTVGLDAQPFLGQEAIAHGRMTPWELRMNHRHVYRNVYLPKSARITAVGRAKAAWLWCGGDATLVGISAAALHGTKWIDGHLAAEICRRDRRHPPGIAVHTYALGDDDACWVDGVRVTTPGRTAFDIGRRLLADRSIPLLDALLRATSTTVADVVEFADTRPGVRGRARLLSALALVDPGAESPQETRLRLLFVRAGLPLPQTQLCFTLESAKRIRFDMGWPEWKVAVEYDGIQHWDDADQREWDIERIAILESLGWAIVRVSAKMLSRPGVIVERVKSKLRQAGWPG